MKKIIFILLFQTVIIKLFGQDFSTPQTRTQPRPESQKQSIGIQTISDSLTKFYLGIGAGLNNYCGMFGIGADVRIYKPFLIRVGAGIGSWGTKLTLGLRYQRKYTKGWVYGIGYSSCSGLKDFKTQLPVVSSSSVAPTPLTPSGSSTAPVTKEVTLDLLHASTINFTTSYNWIFHSHHRFFIEFGYAFALQTNDFVIKDGSVLTDAGIRTINLVQPGGFITGLGVMFGL